MCLLAQVRPLDEGGKLRLTRDMTQLELCVEHLCPVCARGSVSREHRVGSETAGWEAREGPGSVIRAYVCLCVCVCVCLCVSPCVHKAVPANQSLRCCAAVYARGSCCVTRTPVSVGVCPRYGVWHRPPSWALCTRSCGPYGSCCFWRRGP